VSYTSRTYSSQRELRQVLAEVRRSGYAISDRQINPEFVSVAAPIYDRDNTVVASLSLIVPYTESHGPGLAHLVQASARGISRALSTTRENWVWH
jgi:DNA-binding IclR family transcriptional regulator